MSSNIFQIYTANPTTTFQSTDLMYLGRSPYNVLDDFGFTYASLASQFSSSTLTSGNIFVGNSLNVATSVTMSGDATLSNLGVIIVTKTNGVPFSPSATIDTTNASNISSGTLPSGRISGSYIGITGIGTLTVGIWNASIIGSTFGGTGVNNGSSTIIIGGNVTFSGAFTFTGNITANTNITYPTSGTLLSSASPTGNYVSSITGTSNQVIASASTGAVTLSLPQSIDTSSSPTFNGLTLIGTPLGAASGGSGQSSYAVGDMLYASASTTLSKLADVATGNAIISGGVTTAPSWGKIGLTTHISGTLGLGNGGTGTATTFTQGQIVFAGVSGIYTQDTTSGGQFFWDATNHRLGIGITSPISPLHINFSNSDTIPFSGPGGISIGNTSNTNNNWVQLWFLSQSGLISSSISIQVTDQTNAYGDLTFYTRSAAGLTEKLRITGGGPIKFTSSNNFTANGAVVTSLTGVGPTGSHTTVQEWLTIENSSGTTRYIPCF